MGSIHDRPAAQSVAEPELLTVAEAARELRVAPKFVYRHARELGGWRLFGEHGPWRFARHELLAARPGHAAAQRSGAPRRARARKQARTPSGAAILPSKARREAP
jgi:hypothetical protein